jgi:hypothetical protein
MVMNKRKISLVLIGAVSGVVFSIIAIEHLIPFQNIDLESLLIQPNDLPSTLFTGSFEPQGPDLLNWHYDMLGIQTIYSAPDEIAGQVRIYIFHSIKDGNRMLDHLSLLDIYMESQEGVRTFDITPEIGDMMAMPIYLYLEEQGGTVINLAFQRCYSVVLIQFHPNSSHQMYEGDFVAYARKLDERLKITTCDKVKNLLGQ